MNPILVKYGIKLIASTLGKKLLKKAAEGTERRMDKISSSLLPSDNEYLKGRNVAATNLNTAGLYGVMHNTLLKSDNGRVAGCAKNIDKIIPLDLDDDLTSMLTKKLGDRSDKLEGVLKALNLQTFSKATTTDVRDALMNAAQKIATNPNQQNLSFILNRKLQGDVASSIAAKEESSLTEEEKKELQSMKDAFNSFSTDPAYKKDPMAPKPNFGGSV